MSINIDEILLSSPDEHFGATLINIDQPRINIVYVRLTYGVDSVGQWKARPFDFHGISFFLSFSAPTHNAFSRYVSPFNAALATFNICLQMFKYIVYFHFKISLRIKITLRSFFFHFMWAMSWTSAMSCMGRSSIISPPLLSLRSPSFL